MASTQFAVMIAGIAKAGMEDYVKDYLTRLMEQSRQDPGCLAYNIHQSTTHSREFMVYMLWENERCFEQHNQTPLMQEFKKKLAPDMFEIKSPKTYWHIL